MIEIYLYGAIGFEIRDIDIIQQLQAAGGPVTLRVNSLGGDVFEGNAIAAAVKAHPHQVTMIVEGVCASMATVIAMYADTVEMIDNAQFMIHDPRMSVFEADPDQMSARAELCARIQQDMTTAYADKTGLSRQRILDMMAAETWLSASEAQRLGFVDEVIDGMPNGMAAMAASAHRFTFRNQSKAKELLQMKTQLAIFLAGLVAKVATAEVTQAALMERITVLAKCDAGTIQAIFEGSKTVTPTKEQLQACAEALGSTYDELAAEAGHDFAAFKPRIQVQSGGTVPNAPAPVVPHPAAAAASVTQGVDQERGRVNGIIQAFASFPQHQKLRDQCIAQGTDQGKATELLLDAVGRGAAPVGDGGGAAYVVEDQRDKATAGLTLALMGRADREFRNEHRHDLARNEFTGMTLVEMARHCLRVAGLGHNAYGDQMLVVGSAFTTSDFPVILEDIAHKMLHAGWEEADETWRAWVDVVDMSDFKQHSFSNLSEFDDLLEVPEGGEYKDGEFVDQGEKATLATFGRMFSISRQAVINDDMNAFTQIPRRMGRAAARKQGDLAYSVLTANANMADGTALFAAGHSNIRSTGAGAPSTAQFDFMRTQMALQTGPKEKTLGIRPAYCLVPVELEGAAQVVVTAENEVDNSAKNSRLPNSVRGIVQVVSEHRLSADSAAKYYFAANQTTNPTVVMGFLNGDPTPRVEQQEGWRVDGTQFKVSTDAVGKAIDWRGLFLNNGA